MRQIRVITLYIVLWLIIPSCIIHYEPKIETGNINKYVVAGQVIDNEQYQTVSVSMASTVKDPEFIPVPGCFVRIVDDSGHEFIMNDSIAGFYRVRIDKSFLCPGASFKVMILTPDGINLESDFDTMNECPEVDSVYLIRKNNLKNDLGQITNGFQVYLDVNSGNLNSHFFRWEAVETWEYHADYPREWYYDGTIHHISPPDYSRKICWSTQLVKSIYTLSTENLTENKYYKFPLNFIDNHSSRLFYGYSLLIRQYAISEAAYSYWDELRINSTERGGLYEKQPLSIQGNIHNITNPDQVVLGFFGAASVKSKRIFVEKVEDLGFDFSTFCAPETLGVGGLRSIDPSEYPAFLAGNSLKYFGVQLSQYCVDCLSLGGTTEKPDFWPK